MEETAAARSLTVVRVPWLACRSAMPRPAAQTRMAMKLASIRALTGFCTALSSRFRRTPRIPPGASPVAGGASRVSVVGKAKLASTATSAALKVPRR